MNDTEIVRQFYDTHTQQEWERLERHAAEFYITRHYIDRYARPGMRVLDIGGGPGRYSLHLAAQGCRVTLLDLSAENVRFAKDRAAQAGLALTAVQGDACEAGRCVDGLYDCVLLMGPMYHLLREEKRAQAVRAALQLLRPGGVLFVSFLSLYAGFCYYMDCEPTLITQESEREYLRCVSESRTYSGDAFTRACFIAPKDILPFMGQFALEKLHLFSQEGIMGPCESRVAVCDADVRAKWMEIALQTCEREELLSYAEHLMYVGRRTD